MQLHLWNANRRMVESTAVTMSMEDFQVLRSDFTGTQQDPRVATPDL
jgi:hypothetical protein